MLVRTNVSIPKIEGGEIERVVLQSDWGCLSFPWQIKGGGVGTHSPTQLALTNMVNGAVHRVA